MTAILSLGYRWHATNWMALRLAGPCYQSRAKRTKITRLYHNVLNVNMTGWRLSPISLLKSHTYICFDDDPAWGPKGPSDHFEFVPPRCSGRWSNSPTLKSENFLLRTENRCTLELLQPFSVAVCTFQAHKRKFLRLLDLGESLASAIALAANLN